MNNKQKFYLSSMILAVVTQGEERSDVTGRFANLVGRVFPEIKGMDNKAQAAYFGNISSDSISESKRFAIQTLEELEKLTEEK